MRPRALVSLWSLFIVCRLFQKLLFQTSDVVLYLALGQQKVTTFEVRLLDEEHKQEHRIDRIRHCRRDGCACDAITRYQREATDEGDDQPAECSEGVHLITSDARVIVSEDEENAVEQDAWSQDADKSCHLAEVLAEDEDIELRWQQA